MTTELEKTYFITTPIYYVNGLPHVGSALTTVSCDVLARYQRMKGRKVAFLTGTDENATKVQQAAEKADVPPIEFVDGLAQAFQDCWAGLHVEHTDFIRTTEPRHVAAVQEFFDILRAKGYVYLDTYEGWYSVSDETFFRDSEVKEGIAIESGKPVVRVQEQNYFFKLSAFTQPLLDYIEAHPDWLLPEFRKNEVVAFLKEGLRDMCITRTNRGWGIPVPGDESKVIYVWFDAVINYLAATGWSSDPHWQDLWAPDVHFMGKEIFVRFHATLWPAMLLALDLPLPKQVYGHGWWTIGGQKGGKSGASLPHPLRLAKFLAERSQAEPSLAVDALRYLLCREMNFGPDTEFSVENLLRRYNNDLANDLGNLLNRTINMMVKYFEGVVPEVSEADAEIVALAQEVCSGYENALSIFRLNEALEMVWRLVARMNKYIDEKAPWGLAKAANAGDVESAKALAQVLTACLEATRISAVLVAPFMPVASIAILKQLGLERADESLCWKDTVWGGLEAGTQVSSPKPLFPRIQELSVDNAILFALGSANPEANEVKEKSNAVSETQVPVGAPVAPEAPAPAVTEYIGIEDFLKVKLVVAEILAAEPVPNTTKLLRLTVQAGEEDTRTILSGIAEYYTPEELVGRQIVLLANLQPRKMRGIESQGMLLAADVEGKAILLQPDKAVPIGSQVR
jgi:methionyl-tRNA synthetase